MTKSYELTPAEAVQVRAILLTHAEMQDQRTIQNEELRGRLSLENDPEMKEMIVDLEQTNKVLSQDTENLKRLADIFN